MLQWVGRDPECDARRNEGRGAPRVSADADDSQPLFRDARIPPAFSAETADLCPLD
jgi:hypothetical protein